MLYDEVPIGDRPRILGLTASLLNSKVKFDDLETHIQDLEKSMRSCVRTASDHGQVSLIPNGITANYFYLWLILQ